jgi:CHAT domain-containing protein
MGMQPSLKLDNIAMVVPADSGLPFAQEEREYLLGLAGEKRTVNEIPATYTAVLVALASGQYDGWHFSGHGASRSQDANRSAIFLTDNKPFTPEALSGPMKNLGKAKPLVFLNACQVGRGGLSLSDIGGWGEKFLRAGAAAFVGTYWNVSDRPALEFARALYGRLLTGMPIGQAAKEARAEIKAGGDPTWLAYTVFADPAATVVTTPTSIPPIA